MMVSCGAYSHEAETNRALIFKHKMTGYQDLGHCIRNHALRFQIPEWILLSVLWQERGPRHGYLVNSDGTKDYGISCINDIRIKDLNQRGVAVTADMLMTDPCFAIGVTAYLLNFEMLQLSSNQRDWLTAAANYHYNIKGRYPQRHHKYKSQLITHLRSFQKIIASKT